MRLRVNLTKEEFMHAYASQYYDPVKAHEYYERTKKLKGRSTSGMSDEQKKTWSVVKENVQTEKKQKTEEIQKTQTAEIEGLRSEATTARERISAKIKSWIESITKSTTTERTALQKAAQEAKEKIQADRQRKLDALPSIPKTASAAQKERLRASHALKKAAINEDAKKQLASVNESISEKRADISEKASGEKSTARESASQEKKVVAEKLKTSISSVREEVKAIKEALAASTEETLDREYDNIMANIAGKAAKSKKSSAKKASTKGQSYTEANKKFIADNLAKLKSKS